MIFRPLEKVSWREPFFIPLDEQGRYEMEMRRKEQIIGGVDACPVCAELAKAEYGALQSGG